MVVSWALFLLQPARQSVWVMYGVVYGYYEGEDFYYLDRLDVDVYKKEELRKMNVMELRQEIALKIKIFVANSN